MPAAPSRRAPLARAAAVVAVLAFGGKLVAVAKEMVVAGAFGAGDAVDAFLVAYLLPSFAVAVLGGALTSSLVPAWLLAREREGPDAAQRLLAGVTLLNGALLAALAVAVAAALPALLPVLASGFGPEKRELTVSLAWLLAPAVVMGGTSMAWGAVLNAHGRFAAPALAGWLTPLATLALVATAGGRWGAHAIAAGTLSGAALELLAVGLACHRAGLDPRPGWHGLTPDLRRVLSQQGPMAAGALVMSSNPVIDQAMAATLGPGSVAALGYGGKAVSFAMGIGAVSLGQAMLPHFSRLVARGDWADVRRTLRTWMPALLAASLAAALALAWLSEDVVRLLFQRGAFTAADTRLVATVQALLVLQLPFHLSGLLFVRLISAMGANRALMWISFVNAAVNLVGDWVLMRWWGVAGIALSTTLVYAGSFAMAGLVVRSRLRRLPGGGSA